MIRLDRLSKYYSQGGIVTTGLTKVSLELNMGEFVAITGESGSGKSTLLNVISGIDTYEEGEMYIDESPTSGFSVEDLEKYRKEYIANIFQSFNLVNSYTVYQNVEIILLAAGYRKNEIKDKVTDIITRVGLGEYINTKASKLSGGQKQRVAIARALAKDTPVIVADEPTGNLDSVSAADIIRLLNELSKDKLIVIVTHNYEQVEPYVTRKITMSDGAVVEDKQFLTDEGKYSNTIHEGSDSGNKGLREGAAFESVTKAQAGNLSFDSKVRLGVRNAFNIPSKFLLLLIVFLFLCGGSIMEYASNLNSQAESVSGWNSYFATSKDRIVVTKEDRSEFTESDYKKIEGLTNVGDIIKDDIMLDMSLSLEKNDEYLSVKFGRETEFKGRLEKGREPEKSNEICLFFAEDEYAAQIIDSLMSGSVSLNNNNSGDYSKVKITGYGYINEDEQANLYGGNYCEAYIVMSDKALNETRNQILQSYCEQEYEFAGNILSGYSFKLVPNSKVPEGKVYIPEDLAAYSENSASGQSFKITNSCIYFEDKYDFTVGAVYNENNYKSYTGNKYTDESGGEILINDKEYEKMFTKGSYQISVIAAEEIMTSATDKALKDAGYVTLVTKDAQVSYSEAYDKIRKLINMASLVIVLVILFFISYFIIRIIMKSRNTFFSTLRMLGASKTDCRHLIEIELFTVFTIAFAVLTGITVLIKEKIIPAGDYMVQLISYLDSIDFAVMYIILAVISILLGRRYSRQLFKKSAMNTFKEEV